MDETKELINLISTGKIGSAKISLKNLLTKRALENIDNRKVAIARNLFKD